VVVITSTGSVTKRVFRFAEPVDRGLVNWATQYLNDRVAGLELGSSLLRRRLDEPTLGARESSFLAVLRPLFDEALAAEEQSLYVGGTAGLLEDLHGPELESYQRLLEVLEKRAALLGVLSQALDPQRPFIRVGPELEHPALRELSLVGASYGLTNRTLGAVTLLGPVRMDYDKAIRSVRAAAAELSRFVEDVYEDN
jgi:heat-inducible transcriptional repressor